MRVFGVVKWQGSPDTGTGKNQDEKERVENVGAEDALEKWWSESLGFVLIQHHHLPGGALCLYHLKTQNCSNLNIHFNVNLLYENGHYASGKLQIAQYKEKFGKELRMLKILSHC